MCKKKTLVFVALMAALCLSFIVCYLRDPLAGNQRKLFFMETSDYMADYYNVAKYSALRNPYCYGEEDPIPEEHAYPPLAYLISYFQSRCADYIDLPAVEAWRSTSGLLSSSFFIFLEALMLLLLLYAAYEECNVIKSVVTLQLAFSGIFLFSFERGNLIFITAFCTSFFVLNYENKNKYIRELSYAALAVAAGLKAYPALLGVLLLFDRQYKRALRLMIYGIIAFFAPFLFFRGGFQNLPILLHNLQLNSIAYAGREFPRFNFRFWVLKIESLGLQQLIYQVFPIIDAILCGIAVGLAAFQRVRWKKIMLLLLVLVILPVNSAEYTGLYLLVGVILFLNESRVWKLDWCYLALMVVFLNPLQIIAGETNLTQYAVNFSVSALFCILIMEGAANLLKQKQISGKSRWRQKECG